MRNIFSSLSLSAFFFATSLFAQSSVIEKFLKEFVTIPSYAINDELALFVNKLLSLPDSDKLLEKYKTIVNRDISSVIKLLNKDDTYQQLNNKIRVLKDIEKNLKEELKIIKLQKKQKDKQILFLQSIQSLDKDQLMNLQHHIGLYAHNIEGALVTFKAEFEKNKNITEDKIVNFIDRLTLANQKILTINKLAIKSNFLTDSEVIYADIVSFIEEYINTIYIVEDKSKIFINVKSNDISFIIDFNPFGLTIVLDNILNNAKKINSPNKVTVTIEFFKEINNLVIKISNTRKFIDTSSDDPLKVFDKGVTTTSGSGLGLYHVKKILDEMNFDVMVNNQFKEGFQLVLSSKRGL